VKNRFFTNLYEFLMGCQGTGDAGERGGLP
jgi:hypothetical protein